MYRADFRNDEMGYSCAIATLIFVILLVLTMLQMKGSGNLESVRQMKKESE